MKLLCFNPSLMLSQRLKTSRVKKYESTDRSKLSSTTSTNEVKCKVDNIAHEIELPKKCSIPLTIIFDENERITRTMMTSTEITCEILIKQLILRLSLPFTQIQIQDQNIVYQYQLYLEENEENIQIFSRENLPVACYLKKRLTNPNISLVFKYSIKVPKKACWKFKQLYTCSEDKSRFIYGDNEEISAVSFQTILELQTLISLTINRHISIVFIKLPECIKQFSLDFVASTMITRKDILDYLESNQEIVAIYNTQSPVSVINNITLNTSLKDGVLYESSIKWSLTGQPMLAELVKAVGRDLSNYSCADCRAANPTFISITLGVVVCINCALIHIKESVQKKSFVSCIRPIRDYQWSKEQISIIRASGNTLIQSFIKRNRKPISNYNNNVSNHLLSSKLDCEHVCDKKFAESILSNNVNVCKYRNINFTAKDTLNSNLFSSIKERSIFGVMQCLLSGANPNCIDHSNSFFKVTKNDSNIVSSEPGITPLHLACFLGDSTIVELLLRYGADPNLKDRNGFTPLVYATLYDQDQLNDDLVKKVKDAQIFAAFMNTKLEKKLKNVKLDTVAQLKEDMEFEEYLLCEWLSIERGGENRVSICETISKRFLNNNPININISINNFNEIIELFLREADRRVKTNQSILDADNHDLIVQQNGKSQLPSYKYLANVISNLPTNDFRQLLNVVLEELGMREFISIHYKNWKISNIVIFSEVKEFSETNSFVSISSFSYEQKEMNKLSKIINERFDKFRTKDDKKWLDKTLQNQNFELRLSQSTK